MHDAYYWYKQTPVLDYTKYESESDLLKDLVYSPIDRWSYIISQDEFNDYFTSGQYIGIGISFEFTDQGGMNIRYIIPGSPAAEHPGIARGYRAHSINGVLASQISNTDDLNDALGKKEVGETVELSVTDLNNITTTYNLTKQVISVKSVIYSQEEVITSGSHVGYFVLDRFITPTIIEIDELMTAFIKNGVQELIIDFRYNSGGVTTAAKNLASYILKSVNEENIFTRYIHNDRYSQNDYEEQFSTKASTLNLNRVFVITSKDTASASEQFIWGVKPYINVITIGSDTYGKPYGMYANSFCDEVLVPIEFQMQNANYNSWTTDGILPTCNVDADNTKAFGSQDDPLYKAAIDYINDGTCSATASAKSLYQKPLGISVTDRMNGFMRELRAF